MKIFQRGVLMSSDSVVDAEGSVVCVCVCEREREREGVRYILG